MRWIICGYYGLYISIFADFNEFDKMIFDMDAELQHLISLSMDKMTSGASSSTSGRANRRSRGMDLRKAVLVAHFLQDVRCAYIEENYEIVANTIKDFKAIHCEKNEDAMILSENEKDDKDLDKRCNEGDLHKQSYLLVCIVLF